jgi:hypothetical protein
MRTTNILLAIVCLLLLWIGLSMNRIDLIRSVEADSIQNVNIHSVGGRRVFGPMPVEIK